MSSRVPIAVLMATLAMLSGRPCVSVARSRVLERHEAAVVDDPRAVGGADLLPRLAAAAGRAPTAFDANRSLVSSRFESR